MTDAEIHAVFDQDDRFKYDKNHQTALACVGVLCARCPVKIACDEPSGIERLTDLLKQHAEFDPAWQL